MAPPHPQSHPARPLSSPPTQPSAPPLTPRFCFNTRQLRDFLRISRSQLDDTISTSLNSLLTPSQTTPFDPSTLSSPTSNRRPWPRHPIDRRTCDAFINQTLLPSWQNRTQVLRYCSLVAASPDPDDPNLDDIVAENTAAEQRRVDERLDPYSGRFFPRELRTQELAGILRNENAVEAIVRERTWRILGERCEGLGGLGDSWEEGMDRWKRSGSGPSSRPV